MNAWYNGSILIKIIFFIGTYKIILNDSNGCGCYFLKCYYFNLWVIHVESSIKSSKSMWKLVFNEIDVIFNFKVLKGKFIKFIWIMPHVKLLKNMPLGQKTWKTNKNYNSYGLMKIKLNFNHSKVPNC